MTATFFDFLIELADPLPRRPAITEQAARIALSKPTMTGRLAANTPR